MSRSRCLPRASAYRLSRWASTFGANRLLRTPYHGKRIDRSLGIQAARAQLGSGAVDLQMLRPPYSQKNWAFYRNEVIKAFVPQARVAAVQAEMDHFIRNFAPTLSAARRSMVFKPPPPP